jgi:hypothetical protein
MRLLNRLEYKNQQSAKSNKRSADRHLQATRERKDNARHSCIKGLAFSFCLLLTACCLFLAACAPQTRPDGPHFENISLDEALGQYKKISSINAILGIEYEKNDAVMTGDGSISVSPDSLALRIYYLGFLQGEIYQENGVIRSNPKIDRNKSDLLVNGLKSSLFWWNIQDFARTETDDAYELRNTFQKIIVDKITLLPVEQTIALENGETLNITYGRPEQRLTEDGKVIDGNSPLGWYPSRLKIQLRNFVVRITVKSYELTR